MALPPDKLLAFIEEQEDYGVARMPDQGLINLGPLLISHGTPEQRAYWLPRIISGEHVWCQGYSEPNAGSDLASLRTEAVADGDDFIVNGQKIWTTLAHNATHIYLLVRTDKTGEEAGGHQLPARRSDVAGRHGAPDPQHRRRRGVLRGLLRRRARAARQPGGTARTRAGTSPRPCSASSASSSAARRHRSTHSASCVPWPTRAACSTTPPSRRATRGCSSTWPTCVRSTAASRTWSSAARRCRPACRC